MCFICLDQKNNVYQTRWGETVGHARNLDLKKKQYFKIHSEISVQHFFSVNSIIIIIIIVVVVVVVNFQTANLPA